MQEKKPRIFSEVFADCSVAGLSNVIIENIKIYKKENKIEVYLVSDVDLEILDIYGFEDFLKWKFSFYTIKTYVTYVEIKKDILKIPSIWENVLTYLEKKRPPTKMMLFRKYSKY